MRPLMLWIVVLAFPWNCAWGQTLTLRPERPTPASSMASRSQPAPTLIPLSLPTGTPLKVDLDQEVRVQKVGQPVHGKIVEPVYAFDKLVVPAGTQVVDKISAIDRVPKTRRTLAAMNGEFSPSRQVHIDFSELVMPDGRHLPLQTDVSPGSDGILQFVPANEKEKQSKKDEARSAASRKIGEAKKEVRRQWDAVKKQLHEPGKMHRLQRLAVAQLPYHPQYMDRSLLSRWSPPIACCFPREAGSRVLSCRCVRRAGPAEMASSALCFTKSCRPAGLKKRWKPASKE